MKRYMKYHILFAIFVFAVIIIVNLDDAILNFPIEINPNMIFLYLMWLSPFILIFYFVSKKATSCFQKVYINYYYRLNNRKLFYNKLLRESVLLTISLSVIRYLLYFVFTVNDFIFIELILNFLYFISLNLFLTITGINLYIKYHSDRVLTFILLAFLFVIGFILFIWCDCMYLVEFKQVGVIEITIINIVNVVQIFIGHNLIEKEYLYK